MHLHFKHFIAIIFSIFFLSFESKAQRTYHPLRDISLQIQEKVLPMPWSGGLNAALLQTADLTGDGVEELIALDRSSQSLQVFVRQEGQWVARQELVCLLPADLRNWFLMKDYDGDGQKDIFTFTSAGIRLFRNTAAGEEAAAWELVKPVLSYESAGREVNLLVNSSDVPAIEDIDGDGDLDVFTYDPSGGGGLQFYRNMSNEREQTPAAFPFVREELFWGGLSECNCGEFAYRGKPCANKEDHRIMHAGGKSLLLFDVDGDGDFDLLNGFEECNSLYYLENKGSNSEPVFDEFQTRLPGSEEELEAAFPAAFAVDVEQQGVEDLLVSSLAAGSKPEQDLSKTIWWFKTFHEKAKAYQLQSRAFLQEDMLDAGASAIPAFLDMDADDDLDMLLSNQGLPHADGFGGSLQLYENTGTPEAPAFGLSDADFLGLKQQELSHLFPQVLDVNADGRQDILLLARESGGAPLKAFLFLREGGNSSSPAFTAKGSWKLPARLSSQDSPFFFDVNADGLPDLLVGRFDGSLSLFENSGTVESAEFSLEQKSYLGLGMDNYRRPLVPIVGDLTGNGQADLLLADGTGSIRYLRNFQDHIPGAGEPEEIQFCEGGEEAPNWFGRRSWPVPVELRSGEAPLLAVGSLLGGVSLLATETKPSLSEEDGLWLKVFPNPVGRFREHFYLQANMQARIRVISVTGQLVKAFEVKANRKVPVSLSGMGAGVYLVQARSEAGEYSTRLIVLE